MKLRSAPLDEVYLEILLVLDEDGRWPARALLWLIGRLYRGFGWLMLTILRRFGSARCC
jgi:hypothetical protein